MSIDCIGGKSLKRWMLIAYGLYFLPTERNQRPRPVLSSLTLTPEPLLTQEGAPCFQNQRLALSGPIGRK